MQQVKLSVNQADKYLLWVFLSRDKPKVKTLESESLLVEEQLGLKSDYLPCSKAIGCDAELMKVIKTAITTDSYLVLTLEKYNTGQTMTLNELEQI